MGDLKVNEIKTDTIKNQAGTSAITINSSGQISPKLKTSFVFAYAQGTSGYYTVSTGSYLPLTAVYQSKGTGASDFNTTTYKYTAPVNGIYHITCAVISNAASTSTHYNLDIDGTEQYVLTWSSSREAHGTTLHYLNAGEVVGFKSGNNAGYYRNIDTLPSAGHYTYGIFHLVEEIVG